MSWDTRSIISYASTATNVNEDAHEMAQDSVRMDKIHRKIKQAAVQRGVNGIPHLTKAFKSVDRSWPEKLTIWDFKKFLQATELKLNSKDIEALFYYYDEDADGELDYDDFLLNVRNRLDMTQQQIEEILRRIRMRLAQQYGEGVGTVLLQALQAEGTASLTRPQFLHAIKSLNIATTDSELNFIFHHHANTDSPIKYVPAKEFVQAVLLDTSADPDMIHAKLFDAIKDRDRATSGLVGLHRLMLKVDTKNSGCVDQDGFKRVLKAYGCGLLDKEISVLFQFYVDESGRFVGIDDFIETLRETTDLVESPEVVDALVVKLRKILTHKGAHGVIALKRQFRRYTKTGIISLWDFVCAIRDLGVGGNLGDLELEIMYASLATAKDTLDTETFLMDLRGEISETKLDKIDESWNAIDPEGNGSCTVDHLCNAFKPQRMPAVQAGKKTERDVLQEFVDEFDSPSGMVEKHDFISYWCNLAASIPDNNEFTLLLWNAFELFRQPSKFRGRKNNAEVTPKPGSVPHSPPPKQQARPTGGYSSGPAAPSRANPRPAPVKAAPPAAPAHTQSPSKDSISQLSTTSSYASRRSNASQPSQRRPVAPTAAPQPTPASNNVPVKGAGRGAPAPAPTQKHSPVPSPDITPESSPAKAPNPAQMIPTGITSSPTASSVGRGRSCGGGSVSYNIFGAEPATRSNKIVGTGGRHTSQAALNDMNKERPF